MAIDRELQKVTFRVELTPFSEPIEGCLHLDGHPDRPFCGWLDFATAVEEWRGAGARELVGSDGTQPR